MCWQSSQFSCLRSYFGCSPGCSGDLPLCWINQGASISQMDHALDELKTLKLRDLGSCLGERTAKASPGHRRRSRAGTQPCIWHRGGCFLPQFRLRPREAIPVIARFGQLRRAPGPFGAQPACVRVGFGVRRKTGVSSIPVGRPRIDIGPFSCKPIRVS